MAKWEFGLASKDNAIQAKVDYTEDNYVDFVMTQHNVDNILKEVERDKAILDSASQRDRLKTGWRKAFTVPDIVAIEILQKHGLDLHAPETMNDHMAMKKLKYIIKTEYPHLLIST